MLSFSEHVIYQNSSISLSESTIRTLTLGGAAALLLRHSALAALNTKTTALGALSWAVAKKK